MEKIKFYLQNNAGQVITGLAIIIAVIIGGVFYLNKSATGNTLTVTGSARMEVMADNVIWRSSVTHNVGAGELKTGYASMANDLTLVKNFLKSKEVPDTAVTISAVMVTEDWNQGQGAPKRYNLRQNIEVNSGEIEKITAIAKNIDQLIMQGVFFQTDGLEYYYSDLNEARVTLLTDAIADAKLRATAMAKSSGSRVGKLKSASSGVVQVLSRGSVEVSDYGSYDTSKIEKDIMVTVRAVFGVR